jgi:hypothetical protein
LEEALGLSLDRLLDDDNDDDYIYKKMNSETLCYTFITTAHYIVCAFHYFVYVCNKYFIRFECDRLYSILFIVLYFYYMLLYLNILQIRARRGAVGCGTAVQAGRSRVRFPMVSLELFISIILLAALWPWGRLSL